MAGNTFINITDVAGESLDTHHAGAIDVLAWNWGISHAASTQTGAGGAGASAGRPTLKEFSFSKNTDKASPLLMNHCAIGRLLANAVLTVRKPGSRPIDYVRMTMTDVTIASVTTGATGGEERLTENVVLRFGRVTFEYVPQKADGSADVPVKASWDIALNRPF